jgi:hypothetical protein
MSIFADLGLDEMELGAISADLDLYPEDAVTHIAARPGFGDAVEPWSVTGYTDALSRHATVGR